MNYWQECIEESFEEAGIVASKAQIEEVVSWVEGAHENHSLASGHDARHSGPSPLQREIEQLRRDLNTEKNKINCNECNGVGRITMHGPYHSGNSECHICRGVGRISP